MPADVRLELLRKAETCLNEGKGLTPWEEDFLQSVIDTLERSEELSGRQRETLSIIYEEKVS